MKTAEGKSYNHDATIKTEDTHLDIDWKAVAQQQSNEIENLKRQLSSWKYESGQYAQSKGKEIQKKDSLLKEAEEALESIIRHCETYDLENYEPVFRAEQTLSKLKER